MLAGNFTICPLRSLDFDTRRGQELVRMSFAGSAGSAVAISTALERLGRWVG